MAAQIHTRILLGLLALLALAGCDDSVYAHKEDPEVIPKVEGCTVERFVVKPHQVSSAESVYVVRCKPTTTATVTATYGCGKSCTKTVTTITTTEGTPEDEKK
jgi:hypothetical protein